MGISIVVQFDELRASAAGAGTLDGTWRELRKISTPATAGSGVLTHNARIIKLTNNTANDVFISFNLGVTTQDVIPAGGFVLYDFVTNRSNMGGDFMLQEGGFIFAQTVSGGAATGTALYASIIYGKGE